MSSSLSAERDRIQRQVEELEQSLSVNNVELDLLSSETDSDDDDDEEEEEDEFVEPASLMEQRETIQREIRNLENVLGESCVDDSSSSSSSDESDLGLSLSVESCLQMNLVYQQVLQETLDQLEKLLTHNAAQQRELMSQLCGPIREPPREQPAPSSYQQPAAMFLGHFLKPYFKDKLTGLGPPANVETKQRSSRLTGHLDNNRLRMKRWESWQKTLLFHSVSKDHLKRLTQPKLSKVEYLSQKLSSADETDRQQLREQITSLEREIDLLRLRTQEELVGERYDEHDWQKISNIDFEGTREAADIRCFWQNFLHPSVNKSAWSSEEVQRLKEVSRKWEEHHWEEVAQELGTGRTAFMCLQTFQKVLSDSLRRRHWTPAEDEQLRELVARMRIGNFIPYTQVSYFMEGREPSQLLNRWTQVLDPTIKRGLWTKDEDQLLLQAVAHHGEKNWWKIRLEVPGRTYNGCRDRYMDCLKVGTKRGPFDRQEIDLLLNLVVKHGVGRWAKIAAEIPHRNDGQCLRAWRSLGNKAEVRELAKMRRRARLEERRQTAQEQGGGAEKEVTRNRRQRNQNVAQKMIRRRLVKVKMESSEEEEEEEEEEEVQYMDSDDETKKEEVEEEVQVKVEEEEKEYFISPMQEWLPPGPSTSPSLRFCPAAFHLAATGTPPVRCTVLTPSGVSVALCAPPRELPPTARHRGATMMATPEQLRVHLTRLAHPSAGAMEAPRRRLRPRRQVAYDLMAAVVPWIGHLMIQRRSALADIIRGHVERRGLPPTGPFLLLLQGLHLDSQGCKDMIQQRKTRPVAPSPEEARGRGKPGTVSSLLKIRAREQREAQHQLLLNQLREVQQPRPAWCPLLLQCAPPNPSPNLRAPNPPQLLLQSASPNPPQLLLQSAPSTPPAIFLLQGPQRVTPITMSHTAPPAGGAAASTASPALPPAPQSSVPAPPPSLQNVSSTLGNSSQHVPRQEEEEGEGGEEEEEDDDVSCSTEHLPPAPSSPGSTNQLVSSSSSCFSVALDHQYICMNPTAERKRQRLKRGREEAWQAVGGGEASPAGREGKRICRPTEKFQALQEAKTVAKKRSLSRSQRVRRIVPRSGPPELKNPHLGASGSGAPGLGAPSLPALHSKTGQTPVGLFPSALQKLPVILVPARPPVSVQATTVTPSVSSPFLVFTPHPPSRQFPPYGGKGGPLRMEDLLFDPSLMFLEPGQAVCDWLNGRQGLPVGGTGSWLQYLPPFSSSLIALTALLRTRSSLVRASLQLLSLGSTHRTLQPGPQNLQTGPQNLQTGPQNLQTGPRNLQTGPQNLQIGPRNLQTGPGPCTGPDLDSRTPSELPDSTWDLRHTEPGACNSSQERQEEEEQEEEEEQQQEEEEEQQQEEEEEQQQEEEEEQQEEEEEEQEDLQKQQQEEEEEQVAAVRRLVSERFSQNPAYQLLKARFLSCFTLAGLLATVQPIGAQEEGQEELQELDFSEILGGPQSEEGSSLLCDATAAPASHFSGMAGSTAEGTRPKRTRRNQKFRKK